MIPREGVFYRCISQIHAWQKDRQGRTVQRELQEEKPMCKFIRQQKLACSESGKDCCLAKAGNREKNTTWERGKSRRSGENTKGTRQLLKESKGQGVKVNECLYYICVYSFIFSCFRWMDFQKEGWRPIDGNGFLLLTLHKTLCQCIHWNLKITLENGRLKQVSGTKIK